MGDQLVSFKRYTHWLSLRCTVQMLSCSQESLKEAREEHERFAEETRLEHEKNVANLISDHEEQIEVY